MNFLGLARRSVLRKPVKSILLLIVVFVISTLLLAGMVATDYVAPEQNVQNVNVSITPTLYLLDGTGVLFLITASVMVSGIVILKRNPKDILSEMS